MGHKLTISGIGLVAITALIFWAGGCSDDSSISTSILPGSETDPGFLIVQDQVNNYLDSVDVIYSLALSKVYIEAEGARDPDIKPVTEESNPDIRVGRIGTPVAIEGYSDGWHWYQYEYFYDTYSHSFSDSIKFMNDDLYLYLSEGLDYMRYIRHWDYINDATTETHTDLSGYFDIELRGLDGNTATISGFDNFLVEWHYASVDSTVDAVFGVEATIANVEVNRETGEIWANGCPCGGTINLDVNVSYTLTANSFPVMTARSWEITVGIADGVATVTAISNQQYWTYTHTICAGV